MFSINQPLFLSLIQIPNIFWGLGCEFGPQRIWDLAIVCPRSVTKDNVVKLPVLVNFPSQKRPESCLFFVSLNNINLGAH